MIINLQTQEKGVWFPFFYSRVDSSTMDIIYDDPIEGAPRMKIRAPGSFFRDRNKNRKKESQMVLNKKTRAMEKVVSLKELTPEEQKQENDDFADYVIEDIDKEFKIDGEFIKCDRATKIKLMEIPIVAMYVYRCIEILQERGAIEEKKETANLKSGSSLMTTKLDPE